jgi:heat shock protein HslJ
MNRLLVTAPLLALLLIACNSAAGQPLALDGRQFLSVDVTVNGVQRQLVPGTRIQLSFTDGNLGATAGCNHIGGSYRLEGGRLITDAMGMTEMGCDPARHDQDSWLSAFLGTQPQVRLAGSDLLLESSGTIIRLLDREIAEPDVPLTGVRWTLTTIFDDAAAMSVPDGVIATLEFSNDGNFSLHSGCNQGGGRYAIADGTITFSDVVTTEMACAGARAQVEAAVFAVIGAGQVAYEIDSRSLTLTGDGAGLGFTAAAAQTDG